jgi:hypothetical protein
MIATPERQGPHIAMDPHERALLNICRRLIAQGIELEPADVRWWATLVKNWPNDKLAA